MRLAIVHYHLRKGGVTRVIASALEALGESVEAVVLSSSKSEESLPCPVAVVPELAYTEEASIESASSLFHAMKMAARHHLGGDPEVWHIHNHCLGKHAAFPEALRCLANEGARLLLQIHDFAEDGRPNAYMARQAPYTMGTFSNVDKALYPVAPQIGYAVINGRDLGILKQAGIPDDQLHWLPNAVTAPLLHTKDSGKPCPSGPPLLLYPTRAIRRKNLGELMLLASVCPEFRYATTLSPKNPQWKSIHDGWVDLGRQLNLPVQFALAEHPDHSFEQLVCEATAMITTSVGEGFGLAFLEPWLLGKPVVGRDLPEVTGDFVDNGIQLPDLYSTWQIPTGLFEVAHLRERYVEAARSLYAAYGKSITTSSLLESFDARITDGKMDTASLDETAQAEAIQSIVSLPPEKRPSPPVQPDRINRSVTADNVKVILSLYGLTQYGQKLSGIYADLLSREPEPTDSIPSIQVLEGFLDLPRFKLLLT